MVRRLVLLLLLVCFPVYAFGVPSITESNDYFSSFLSPSDKSYTQGVEIASIESFNESPSTLQELAALLPQIICGSFCPSNPDFIGIAVGQQMHTPHDRDSVTQDINDQPYAGWLYARLTRMNQLAGERISTSLYIGTTGPAALGEEAQNGVHQLLNQKKWMGWDNQIHNEVAFYLSHKRSFISNRFGNSFGGYFISSSESNAGTVYSSSIFKEELRLGYNLRGYNFDNKEFSIYTFIRPGVSLVAHNIFLDGNTYEDSYRVTKVPIVGSIEGGLGIEYYGYKILYTINFSSKDFDTQDDNIHGFASIRIEKLFNDN